MSNVNDAEFEEDFNYEIEDDTPPEDKGRTRASDDSDDDDIEDEELRNFSEAGRARINKLTRQKHDERRAKEAKERELREATNVIQRLNSDVEKLRKSLTGAATSAVSATKTQVESEIASLKKQIAEAIDNGEGEKVADLSEKLTDAKWKLNGAISAESRLKIEAEQKPNPQQQQDPNDQSNWPTERKSWAEKNKDWFHKEEDMTALAYGVHQKLINAGVKPDTEEYFSKIDKEVRKRFPDYFENKEDQDGTEVEVEDEPKPRRAEQRTSHVQGGGSSKAGGGKKKVYKLKQSQLDLCKRLNITPQQYVKQLAEMDNDQ